MSDWLDELTEKSPMKSSIGWRGELEFAGATEDDRAGRTVKFRIIRPPAELGSAHPFATFTRRRGRRAGTVFEASVFSVSNSDKAVYCDQVMLLNWTDGPSGSTVAFLLCSDEIDGPHPFLGYSRPSKQVAGSRFMAVMLEVSDDNQIIDQEQRERAEMALRTGREQKTSNVAAMICKNPRFHDYLREQVEAVDWSEALATKWLKKSCEIDSRAELDDPKNRGKIVRFEAIRKAFVAWQEEQGDDLNPLR